MRQWQPQDALLHAQLPTTSRLAHSNEHSVAADSSCKCAGRRLWAALLGGWPRVVGFEKTFQERRLGCLFLRQQCFPFSLQDRL